MISNLLYSTLYLDEARRVVALDEVVLDHLLDYVQPEVRDGLVVSSK